MLYDADFLRELDLHREKTTYARIISLDMAENPIEQVEGQVTQGSVNVDGNSAVRRTCSLTMVAQDVNINDYYWGLNTKFKLEIGVENRIDPSYPEIIWFKMGTYIITSFNTSFATNNFTISLQGKDKMCLLNGEVGGVINATTDFGTYDFYDKETGITTNYKLPIKQILWDAVHAYANEPFHNIVLNDLDELGLELLEYRYDTPLYLVRQATSDEYSIPLLDGNTEVYTNPNRTAASKKLIKDIVFDKMITSMIGNDQEPTVFYMGTDKNDKIAYCAARITYGQTAGYHTCDLVYAGDLIANIGDSVTSVFDKIKSMLGQFEYFYDLDGRFIFQRQKSLVNTVWTPQRRDGDGELYVESLALASNSIYNFTGSILITSFQNNPNLLNLRNDYTVWGNRKSLSGGDIPIHMRYAIDNKPYRYVDRDKNVWTTLSEEEVRAENASKAKVRSKADIYAAWENFKRDPDLYPSPLSVNGDWWEIGEWAEFYKILFQEYPGTRHPDDEMRNYCTGYGSAYDVCAAWNSVSIYNTQTTTIEVYFYNKNGVITVRTSPHGSCVHTYKEFMDVELYVNEGVEPEDGFTYKTKAQLDTLIKNDGLYRYLVYAYAPQIPEDRRDEKFKELEERQEFVDPYAGKYKYNMDWREVIYRMAIDYRRYNHDDDFEIILAQMNDPLYPRGQTGYEQYYTDLEGFWRQLYYPTFSADEKKKQLEFQYMLYRDIEDKQHDTDLYVKGCYKPVGTKVGSVAEEKMESGKSYLHDKSTGRYYYCNPNVKYYYSDNYGISFKTFEGFSSSGTNGQAILDDKNMQEKFMKYVSEGCIFTRDMPDITSLFVDVGNQIIPFMDQFNYVTDSIEHYLKVTDADDPQNPRYELITEATQQLSSAQKSSSYVMTKDGRAASQKLLADLALLQDMQSAINEIEIVLRNYIKDNTTGKSYTKAQLKNIINEEYASATVSAVDGYLTTIGNAANPQTQIVEAVRIQSDIQAEIDKKQTELNQTNGQMQYQLYSEYIMQNSPPKMDNVLVYDAYNLYPVSALRTHTILKKYYWDSSTDTLPQYLSTYSLNNKGEKLAVKKNTAIQYYQAFTNFYGGPEDDVPLEYCYWNKDVFDAPQSLNFWFDFLTGDGELRQYTTQAVGDRPKAVNETSVKSIYYRDTPKIIFTSAEKLASEEKKTGYNYFVMPDGYENMFTISAQGIDAKNRIDELLYQYSYCTESVTINSIPIYYLDVNKRIHVYDDKSGIDGDYVVSRISYPLQYNGMMSISATKAPENSVTEREE